MIDVHRSVDLAALQVLWPLPVPWAARSVGLGTNNHTTFVDTPAGAYVLRLCAESDPEAVRYEHDVMISLQRAGLPFAVPAPLPTVAGPTVARVPGRGPEVLASLTPLLPGAKPEAGDLAQAWRAAKRWGT